MQERGKASADRSVAGLTTEIVSAYVSHNTISTTDIGRLIVDIAGELQALGEEKQAVLEKPQPAVPVRRSVSTDHLVCLVCGKKQRLLKRHLATEHDLTPDAYRQLFDLKADYPMAAPSYAEMRREFALKIGLGRPKKPEPKKRAASKNAAASKRGSPERLATRKAEASKPRRTRAKATTTPPAQAETG